MIIPRYAPRYHCNMCNSDICEECVCGGGQHKALSMAAIQRLSQSNAVQGVQAAQNSQHDWSHGRLRSSSLPLSPTSRVKANSLRGSSIDDIILPLTIDDEDLRSMLHGTLLTPSRPSRRMPVTLSQLSLATASSLQDELSPKNVRATLDTLSPNVTFSDAPTVASEEDLSHSDDRDSKNQGATTFNPEAEWIYYNEEEPVECEPRVEWKPIRLDGKTTLSLKVEVEGLHGIIGSAAPALPVSDLLDDCFL